LTQFLKFALGLLIVTGLASTNALAFPETSRHGYLSCTTCHFSPSGRGLLTPYGKTLAHELYSFKKTENPSDSLEAETPWWQIGGHIRMIQLINDSKSLQKGRFFLMQSEIEGAIEKESWALVASAGVWKPMDSSASEVKGYSRTHYALLRLNENWVVRGGHFRINHGLGLPDHTALVNQALEWTHSHETYNLEASYLEDSNILQGTLIAPSKLLVTAETIYGTSVTAAHLWNSKQKLGINLSRFIRSDESELQANIHTILALSDTVYLQAELAQRKIESNPRRQQYALFSRLSHDWNLGIKPFVQFENAVIDRNQHLSAQRYALGAEWFPMVNFDLFTLIGKESQTMDEDTLVFNAIGHFYF
jgi:hypothetical protein